MSAWGLQLARLVMEIEQWSGDFPGAEENRERVIRQMRESFTFFMDECEEKIRTAVKDQLSAREEARDAHKMLEAVKRRMGDEHKLSDNCVRQTVWELTDGKCAYCDVELAPPDLESAGQTMYIEHVVPRSRGGPDNLVNYVPACASCNTSKRDGHVLNLIRRLQKRADAENVIELKRDGAAR